MLCRVGDVGQWGIANPKRLDERDESINVLVQLSRERLVMREFPVDRCERRRLEIHALARIVFPANRRPCRAGSQRMIEVGDKLIAVFDRNPRGRPSADYSATTTATPPEHRESVTAHDSSHRSQSHSVATSTMLLRETFLTALRSPD